VNVLLDLDGVVWLEGAALPGAVEAVARLRARGDRVVFFTNNSIPTLNELRARFQAIDIPCAAEDLLSSSLAAAALIEPGERVLVLGGSGIAEAVRARGATVIEPGERGPAGPLGRHHAQERAECSPARADDKQQSQSTPHASPSSLGSDGLPAPSGLAALGALGPGGPPVVEVVVEVVVVGLDPCFDYRRLTLAMRAIAGGARLIGTNDDATFPTGEGLLPGGGSLLAAVATASGVTPVIAGKPHPAAAALVANRVGPIDLVVGDRASTDGRLATELGARFALVWSGVTPADHGPLDPSPDYEHADLAGLVQALVQASDRMGR